MNKNNKQALSALEENTVGQALELFMELDAGQLERVWAHVQERLATTRVAVSDGDQVMFSRGLTSPLGKLDYALKTKVDEQTHALFLRRCAMQNTDASNELRNCVYAIVHGKSYDQMVIEKLSHAVQRTEALTKLIGPFGGPELAE